MLLEILLDLALIGAGYGVAWWLQECKIDGLERKLAWFKGHESIGKQMARDGWNRP